MNQQEKFDHEYAIGELNIYEFGQEMKQGGLLDYYIQIKLERATTKAEYIAHCTEMKPLIVAWGWQKEIKAHYADWCKRKGLI
jgi:hypothetical protein